MILHVRRQRRISLGNVKAIIVKTNEIGTDGLIHNTSNGSVHVPQYKATVLCTTTYHRQNRYNGQSDHDRGLLIVRCKVLSLPTIMVNAPGQHTAEMKRALLTGRFARTRFTASPFLSPAGARRSRQFYDWFFSRGYISGGRATGPVLEVSNPHSAPGSKAYVGWLATLVCRLIRQEIHTLTRKNIVDDCDTRRSSVSRGGHSEVLRCLCRGNVDSHTRVTGTVRLAPTTVAGVATGLLFQSIVRRAKSVRNSGGHHSVNLGLGYTGCRIINIGFTQDLIRVTIFSLGYGHVSLASLPAISRRRVPRAMRRVQTAMQRLVTSSSDVMTINVTIPNPCLIRRNHATLISSVRN